MDTLAQSFASLVSTNNGMFKSEKQAKFLLSMINKQGGNSYITSGNVWGNSFNMEYFCDDKGVTKVTKYSKAKGTMVEWTRKVEGEVSVQDAKRIKSLTRQLKEVTTRIAAREAALAAGGYADMIAVYEDCMAADKERLVNINTALSTLK